MPSKVMAELSSNEYLNDFFSKSREVSILLKEIETTLKEGWRNQVCKKQKIAAELSLLANKSLIKAFEISGTEIPETILKNSTNRWESILNECN